MISISPVEHTQPWSWARSTITVVIHVCKQISPNKYYKNWMVTRKENFFLVKKHRNSPRRARDHAQPLSLSFIIWISSITAQSSNQDYRTLLLVWRYIMVDIILITSIWLIIYYIWELLNSRVWLAAEIDIGHSLHFLI